MTNNFVNLGMCLVVDKGISLRKFSSINVIGNNSPANGVVTIWDNAELYIEDSIFQKNSGILFFNHLQSILHISNCWVVHSNTLLTGTVFSSNLITTTIFTNTLQIRHFGSIYCNALSPWIYISTVVHKFQKFSFCLHFLFGVLHL